MDENVFSVILMGVVALMSLAVLALYVWSIVWAFSDAEKRGKSGCLVAILVALVSWPLGLVIWLVARPEDERR